MGFVVDGKVDKGGLLRPAQFSRKRSRGVCGGYLAAIFIVIILQCVIYWISMLSVFIQVKVHATVSMLCRVVRKQRKMKTAGVLKACKQRVRGPRLPVVPR